MIARQCPIIFDVDLYVCDGLCNDLDVRYRLRVAPLPTRAYPIVSDRSFEIFQVRAYDAYLISAATYASVQRVHGYSGYYLSRNGCGFRYDVCTLATDGLGCMLADK